MSYLNRMYFKGYELFEGETSYPLYEMGEAVNEGLFDKLTSIFSKFAGIFKDQAKLQKSVESTVTQSGAQSKNFDPKAYKVNQTAMVVMGSPQAETGGDFTIAFTKMADMPDGSGLFQITGTTSPVMLKALVGTEKNEDLAKNSVMALIPSAGFVFKKPATMRILKNIIPGGKDYVTKTVLVGSASSTEVEKTLQKMK
jgi:hypothetical protein